MTPLVAPFLVTGPSFRDGRAAEPEVAAFRAEIPHEPACRLFDYWLSKGSEAAVAHKDEIDPIDLPQLLPAIYMEEWDSDLAQSRIRLAGEFHREIAGGNVQGLSVDEHATGAANALWKQCDQLNFFELRPTFCGYSLAHIEKEYKTLADLTLPLRGPGDSVLTIGLVWFLED